MILNITILSKKKINFLGQIEITLLMLALPIFLKTVHKYPLVHFTLSVLLFQFFFIDAPFSQNQSNFTFYPQISRLCIVSSSLCSSLTLFFYCFNNASSSYCRCSPLQRVCLMCLSGGGKGKISNECG